MASVTLTFPANTGANAGFATGDQLRKLGRVIQNMAADLPDRVGTGASITLLFDNTTTGNSPGFVALTAGGVVTTRRI